MRVEEFSKFFLIPTEEMTENFIGRNSNIYINAFIEVIIIKKKLGRYSNKTL